MVRWDNGLFNQPALHFDGADTLVTIPDLGDFNMPAFTIKAYVNRAYNGHGWKQIVRRDDVIQNNNQFEFGFGEDFLQPDVYCFGYTGIAKVGGGFHTPLGGWTHVAETFDGINLADYINGVLDQSNTNTNMNNSTCPSRSAGVGDLCTWETTGQDPMVYWRYAICANPQTLRVHLSPYASYLTITNSFPSSPAVPLSPARPRQRPLEVSTPTPTPVPNPDYGDGRDGDLSVTGTTYTDDIRSPLSSNAQAGQFDLAVATTAGFTAGDNVLIAQMQGDSAGTYEMGTLLQVGTGSLTLQYPLQYSYSTSGNARAQVIRVPNYNSVAVQSGEYLPRKCLGWHERRYCGIQSIWLP